MVLVEFLRVVDAPVAHHSFFVSGRLATPISYPNADCALLLMAAFPAIVVASLRDTPVLIRGILFATAGVAAELALACQSRMSLLAAPLTLLFLFGLVRRRMGLLAALLPVALVVDSRRHGSCASTTPCSTARGNRHSPRRARP